MRFYRPFELFNKPGDALCIWLNGVEAAERSCWAQVWNSCRRRVCTDGAANVILGRKEDLRNTHLKPPHTVCGDFDSIKQATIDTLKENKIEVVHTPDQDHTDLHKTIGYCLEQKKERPTEVSFEKIFLLGGLSGRFDHTMSTLSSLTFYANFQTPIYVLDNNNLAFCLSPGDSSILVDKKMCTRIVGVAPIAQRTTSVSSCGLKWNLKDTELEFGRLVSTSNEVVDNEILLTSNAPLIFTFELKI